MAQSTPKKITVLIVDDHSVLSDSLTLVLNSQEDIVVVGACTTLAQARALIPMALPQVVLLDIEMPDGNGLDIIGEIKTSSPHTNTIVLTSHTEESALLRAIDSGVSGFVPKNRPISDVLMAIRQAADGEITMPSTMLLGLLSRALQSPLGTADRQTAELSQREMEVLQLLASGKSSDGIAESLHISILTARTHIRNIIAKLGAHSRLEAVAIAVRQRIISIQ